MVFVVMILALGAGTFMLRDAASAQVIGAGTGYGGDNGPAIEASLDAPGGIAVTSAGDVYFADSNNHVIRRIDARNNITTVAGENAARRRISAATSARRPRRSSTRRATSRSRPTATW